MDRQVKTLLALAAGCVLLFAAVLAGAYAWGPATSLDLRGLTGFVQANNGSAEAFTGRLVQLGNPAQVALITLVLAALAVLRGRPRMGLVVVLLVAGTSVASQVLKTLLAHPRVAPILGHDVGPDAFPSGHATAAMALALAAVLAAPRRARLAAAVLGSLLALAVGASVVAMGWHFPSDVLGGYLLATGWAFALVAGLHEADRRFPASNRWAGSAVARASERVAAGGLAAVATGGAGFMAVAGLALLVADPAGATCFARAHTASVFVGGAVASAALALPVTVATVVRRG